MRGEPHSWVDGGLEGDEEVGRHFWVSVRFEDGLGELCVWCWSVRKNVSLKNFFYGCILAHFEREREACVSSNASLALLYSFSFASLLWKSERSIFPV